MEKEPMTLEKLGEGIEKINKKLDDVDLEVRKLGVTMEEMDDKFSLITEGQDIIRDVLETRVAHIEEMLEIKTTV
jgi:hypothetical protein